MSGDVTGIERAAVVGAGGMGRGIAAVTALAGYEVTLCDIDPDQLTAARDHIEWSYDKTVERGAATEAETEAALDRLATTTDLEEAAQGVDIATEAVVERLDVKRDIFAALDRHAPPEAVLTTNTSGLNVTALAEHTDRPGQVCGTHWFNPPMLMELVELVETEHLEPAVADTVEAFVESLDRTVIRCRVDVPSFIVNRLMRPYGETAAWLAFFDEASYEEIDGAMEAAGFPMGPFTLADYTGGIQLRVEGEGDHLEDDRPLAYDTTVCPLLHELYEEGRYGRKSGAGYYDYTDREEPDIPAGAGESFDPLRVWAPVINEAAKLVQHDVATVEDVDTGAKLGGNWPVGPLEKADEVGADTVVRYCTRYAAMHDSVPHLAEALPCELLVETAKEGGMFY